MGGSGETSEPEFLDCEPTTYSPRLGEATLDWGPMNRISIAAGVLVVLLLGTGCSGDDSSSSDSGADATEENPASEGDDSGSSGDAEPSDDAQSSTGGSATVTLGGSSYEMTDSMGGCGVADDGTTILASFSNGANTMTLTSADDVILVRMTLDGEEWVDNGDPAPAEISDSGATWSGELSHFNGDEAPQEGSIVLTC